MTIDDLLSHLDAVRRSGHGWMARCPAHADHHPSLSVSEGERGILVKCWAGCELREITAALGLRVADLFLDDGLADRARRGTRHPTQYGAWRFDWRKAAARLEDHALSLSLRAQAVLGAASGLDCSGWQDADLNVALAAVGRAYEDLARAQVLEDVAFALRVKGLTQERSHHASRRSAA